MRPNNPSGGGEQPKIQQPGTPFVGSKISLISKSDIRYEGILYNVDTVTSTVALRDVKMFGTEGRRQGDQIPQLDKIYPFIIFKGSDIKDLTVCEPPQQTPPPPSRPQDVNVGSSQQGPLPYPPNQGGNNLPGFPNPGMMPPPNMNPYMNPYFYPPHMPYGNPMGFMPNPMVNMPPKQPQPQTQPNQQATNQQHTQQRPVVINNVPTSPQPVETAKTEVSSHVSSTTNITTPVVQEDVKNQTTTPTSIPVTSSANSEKKPTTPTSAKSKDKKSFEEEFDIQANLQKLDKNIIAKELEEKHIHKGYDRQVGFFDTISRESDEKKNRRTKQERQDQQKLDLETFGETMSNGRGGFRGGRGGRGSRGSYRGRGNSGSSRGSGRGGRGGGNE